MRLRWNVFHRVSLQDNFLGAQLGAASHSTLTPDPSPLPELLLGTLL